MTKTNSIRPFLHSTTIFTASGILVNLLGYLFHLLAARLLGPGNYSEITTVFAYGILLSTPIMVISVVIIGQSGSHVQAAAREKFLNSLRVYFDSFSRSFPAFMVSYLLLSLFGYFNHLSLATAFIMPAFVLTFLYAQLYPILLQSAKRFTTLSLILLVTGVLKLVTALAAFILPSASLILLLMTLVNLVQIYYSRHKLPLLASPPSSFSPTQILTDSRLKLTFISLVGLIALNNLDIVLAKQILPADSSGMYGIWSLFAKAITYSFLPLSSVALVFFTDRLNQHQSQRILTLSALFLSFTGLATYFLLRPLSEFLIINLMGSDFAPLVTLLPLSAIFGTVYSLIYLLNNYYLSIKSRFAYLPAIFSLITIITLAIMGQSLSAFILTITVCGTISLLLYPMLGLLRTKLAFFPLFR